jgi:hypothetical protein
MPKELELLTQEWMIQSSPKIANRQQQTLLRGFWLIALALFVFELFFTNTASLKTNLAAILITAAALLPTYLWCADKALGMPVFPLFAVTFVWTHALPLVTDHPKVLQYTANSHLFASLTVSGFLGLATYIWFQFVKSTPPEPKSSVELNSRRGEPFFLLALVALIFFNIYKNGGWFFLDGGTYAATRGVVLGLSALANFVLAYRMGTKELSQGKSGLFLCLLLLSMVTSTVGLLLVDAASQFLVATVGFTIGRKKLPILIIIVMLLCISFLHYGKGEMRGKYWFGGSSANVQPWEYPAWYAEWAGYSSNYLFKNQSNLPYSQKSEEKQSFLERSSTIHLLLLAQHKSPDEKPFLYGTTYAILPQLLIPRIFNNKKIASHEGTYLLNIHYGLQTRKDTFKTTIGWGLLAESYANFGLVGCAGLATILGFAYGKATRLSINAPILSAKFLFATLMIIYAFQTEFSAGVYVAALFQSGLALGAVVLVMMKKYRVPSSIV